MKTWLPDVNILIALLDPDHVHHDRAHDWFGSLEKDVDVYLSCPMTQNAVLRIMSHPSYPNTQPLGLVRESLASLLTSPQHSFVPDSISLLPQEGDHGTRFLPERLTTSGMVTDSYLLLLAIANDALLATFDRRLQKAPAIAGDSPAHLIP